LATNQAAAGLGRARRKIVRIASCAYAHPQSSRGTLNVEFGRYPRKQQVHPVL
jgi:hypothetical protein